MFTRDLRLHDHPALYEALRRADGVVPAFVFDDGILKSRYGRPNRVHFLIDSLKDLDSSLRARGARLVTRRGHYVRTTMALIDEAGAEALYMSADYSHYAQRREGMLRAACAERGVEFQTFEGVTVVPPGAVTPGDGDHFKVFTPYFNKWKSAPRRSVHQTPRSIEWPESVDVGSMPAPSSLVRGSPSAEFPRVERARDDDDSAPGCAPGSRATRVDTTISPPTTLRDSAPTFTSDASLPATSNSERAGGREAMSSCGRCAGATSTTRFLP